MSNVCITLSDFSDAAMKKVMLKRLKKVVPAKVSREEIELEIESQLERKGLLHHAFGGEGNNQVSNVFSVTIFILPTLAGQPNTRSNLQ